MTVLRWKDGINWWMRFDAVTVEELTRDAEISTFPVETGAILSDHYQPQPRRILLTGMVSDTPSGSNWTNLLSGGGTDAEKAPQPTMRPHQAVVRIEREQRGRGPLGIPRPISTTTLPSQRLIRANIERARLEVPRFVSAIRAAEGDPVNRIQTFVLALDGLVENKIPVTVVISGGIEFKDMMITSFSAPRVSGSGGSVRVRMDLQQVTAADPTETVKAAAVRTDPAVKSTKAKGAKGTRRPKDKQQVILDKLIAGGNLEPTSLVP